MTVHLANHAFKHSVGILEDILVQVGEFVIL